MQPKLRPFPQENNTHENAACYPITLGSLEVLERQEIHTSAASGRASHRLVIEWLKVTPDNGTTLRYPVSKSIWKTVGRGVAAIMLGAATTVAVAWSLALFVDGSKMARWRARYDIATQVIPTPPQSPQQTGVHFAQVMRARRWGTEIVQVGQVWSEDRNRPPYGSPPALLEGTSFATEVNEKFGRNEVPTAWWRADGWPFLALSAEARWWSFAAPGVSKVAGGLLLGSRQVSPGDGVRMLPLQPVWKGLILDTIFFALLWYALLSVGSVRSRLRRRRGLCGRCGYALQPEQSRCSECGEPVAQTIATKLTD